MNYINPFGIISIEQFKTLGRSDLKGLRKKILLEFDLSDSNEIVRENKGYDKNEVLEIFQSLETHLELYQKLSILPKLRQFLEDGNLSFFSEEKETQLVIYDPKHKQDINSLITKKLINIIPPIILEPKLKAAERLKEINAYLDHVSSSAREEAYNRTFLELTHVTEELKEIKDPFLSQTNLRIKPKVKKYINKVFYASLLALPESFNKLKSDYGLWCNNNVLVPGIKHKRINSAPRESLVVIRNAAKIASNFHNKQGNLKIVKQLDSRIKGILSHGTNGETSGSDSGFKWYHLIYIVILFIKVPLLISKCNSNNSRSSYNNSRSYTNNKQQKEFQKLIKQAQRNASKPAGGTSSSSSSRNNSAQLFRYCGEDRQFINPSYTGEGNKNGEVELRYDVDVLPAKNTFFHLMIPDNIKTKFKGEIMPIIFTFTDRDFRKNKFSHEVKIDFRKDKLQAEYNFKRPEEGMDDILKTKKLFNRKMDFTATISRVDPINHNIKHKRKFNGVFREGKENFRIRFTNPAKNLILDKDYTASNPEYKKTVGQDSIRIAAAIKNLKLIPSSRLKRNGIYTMANIATYDLENIEGLKLLGIKKPNTIEGRLKYRITSVVDNTALCSVTGQNFAAFYYVDAATSKIRAMTMAVKSKDGKNLELIEVHLN